MTLQSQRRLLFLLAVAVILMTINTAKSQTIPINSGWQFREVNKDTWYPAKVPGCVHTDLLDNKLIEDPFYRDNEQKQQWIGKTDWEYRTTFKVTQQLLNHRQIELVFEGLDTYADVYLNEQLILKADNMFRTWRVSGALILKPGDNSLRLRFRSPINEVLPIMAKMSYQLPASNDQGEKTSPHTRKAPYQFGWDWGPRFVTSGIWRPIVLEAWDSARISDLHIVQKQVSKEQAKLTAQIDVITTAKATAQIVLENVRKGVVAKQQVELAPGPNHFSLD